MIINRHKLHLKLKKMENKNKFNSREIIIGIILVLILIAGSYAANYYLPQNQKIDEQSYIIGAREIAFQINNNSIIPIWNSQEQDYQWVSLRNVCEALI